MLTSKQSRVRSQIQLGSVFGIKIGLHYSWFLIALLIVFSLSSQFHASNPAWGDGIILAMAIGTALLFFVSLLLHELAHSLVATSNQLPVKEITLFALGGVSQIEKNPTSAKVEFWMAFVGPLTSAVHGGVVPDHSALDGGPSSNPWMAMLLWLGYINLVAGCFQSSSGLSAGWRPRAAGADLVEDGRRGPLDATRGASGASGRVRVHRAGHLSIFQEAPVSEGCGSLSSAGFCCKRRGKATSRVGLAHALQGVKVADMMTRDCPTVDGWMNVAELRRARIAAHRAAVFYGGG